MGFFPKLCSVKSDRGKKEVDIGPLIGVRHVQVFLYFLLLTYTYCMRTVLSVAIVAMNNNSTTTNTDIETFHWTNQSIVLSAFFYGYILLQVPVAQLGKKYGPKWMLVVCTTVDSTSFLLIPTMASYFGSIGVIVCRVFQGLAQGGIAPLVHTLLGCWAPAAERSVLGTVTYAGAICGNILSLPITGVICSSWAGWPAAFYLFGALGLKWVILWMIFGSNSPSEYKTISEEEKSYIQTSLGQRENKKYKTPWKKILTSPPFWAVTLAFAGANWGSSVLLTQTPTYLSKVLNYDIRTNSLFSAAPYVAMGLSSVVFSSVCDWIINRNIVGRGTARKIFNSIGMLLPALSLSILGFVSKEHAGLSVALLIFNGGITAGGLCGFQVNHVDLSPNHSGILMGITNSSTSVFSIIPQLLVQFMVTGDMTDQSEWRIVFLISAGVYFVTDIFFIMFASGEVQEWNECEEIREDAENPEKQKEYTKE